MFPERLRALRRGQRMTLDELAAALNAKKDSQTDSKENTPAQIGNWERGVRTPSYLEVRKLAEYFDVTVDYLTGRAEQDEYDLGKIFLSGKQLSFNQQVLSSEDRYEIFQLMSGYLHGKSNRRTPDAEDQESLDLKLDD